MTLKNNILSSKAGRVFAPPFSFATTGLMLCAVVLAGCSSVPAGPPMEAEGSTGYPAAHIGSLIPIQNQNQPTPEAFAEFRRFAAPGAAAGASKAAAPIVIHEERISAARAQRSSNTDIVMTVVHNFYRKDDKGAMVAVGSVVRAFEADCLYQRFNDMGVLAVTTGLNGQGRVYAGSREANAQRVKARPGVYGQPSTALAPRLYDFACAGFGPRAQGSTQAPTPARSLQTETKFLACAPRDRDLDRRRSNLQQSFSNHEENFKSLQTRKAWLQAAQQYAQQNRQPVTQSLRDSINRFNADNDRHTARARELQREQARYNSDLRSYRRDCDDLMMTDQAARHICRDINHYSGVCAGLFDRRPGAH